MLNLLATLNIYQRPRLYSATSEFHLLRRCLLYYPNLNILYTYIPKNACSTLKYTLGVHSGIISQKDNPHETEHLFYCADKYALYPSNCRTVICFREPFERILSAYLDKFARIPVQMEALAVIAYLQNRDLKKSKGKSISFLEFIYFLSQVSNHDLDAHWRPQIDFIFFDKYTDILCLEQLSSQWQQKFPQFPLLNYTKHSHIKTKSDKYYYAVNGEQLAIEFPNRHFPNQASFMNPEIQQLFNQRFQDDLMLYQSLTQ